MARTGLEKTIGSRRYREYKQGLEPDKRVFTFEIFRFDVELRALLIKGVSIIEIALQNQILALSRPIKFQSFGHARRALQELSTNKQFAIANRFGCTNGKEFRALLRVLNDARNRSAHHERIWNCKLDFCLPHKFTEALISGNQVSIRPYSIAGAFFALMHLLKEFPEIIELQDELDNLLSELPIERNFVLARMGFEVP